MSKVSIQGDISGTGDFTIKAPNSNVDRTLNLPDEAGTLATVENLPAGYTDSDALDLFNATGSAPVYACRAWVNFDGTGTVSIRDSGNVSSITDNGTGDYTVNFATAMPDNSYSFFGMVASTNDNWSSRATNPQRGASGVHQHPLSQPTSTSIRVETLFGTQEGSDGGLLDFSSASISIFR